MVSGKMAPVKIIPGKKSSTGKNLLRNGTRRKRFSKTFLTGDHFSGDIFSWGFYSRRHFFRGLFFRVPSLSVNSTPVTNCVCYFRSSYCARWWTATCVSSPMQRDKCVQTTVLLKLETFQDCPGTCCRSFVDLNVSTY